MCQLVIWGHQRAKVRPSLLTVGGQDSSSTSSASRVGVSERDGGAGDLVDASYGFGGVPGCADFSVGSPALRRPGGGVRPRSLMRPEADVRKRGSGSTLLTGVCGPYARGFRSRLSAYFVESLIWRGASHGMGPRLAARWEGPGRRPCDWARHVQDGPADPLLRTELAAPPE